MRVTSYAVAVMLLAIGLSRPAVAQANRFSEPGLELDVRPSGLTLPFVPLDSSAACTQGGPADHQVVLPSGLTASIIAAEGPGYPDNSDQMTVNENGPTPGRFLYRTHEISSSSAISVTDLFNGATSVLARHPDWEMLDGIVWTPWGTLLVAEESNRSRFKDPSQPNAIGGHVYEIDPQTGVATVRPAVGARSHEGMRFDQHGNLYGISETAPGYIFKFTPDHHNDLSSGQLYALHIVNDLGNKTGWAEWVALDRDAVLIDAKAEAAAKGATGYLRPEDVEIGTSTGDDRRGNHRLFVSITGENRVLAIYLDAPGGARGQVLVTNYVARGLNAPDDFEFPDNLALDRRGNLYIAEDPPGNTSTGKKLGDDVWFAPYNEASGQQSLPVQRFLSITDCDAEPTGLYLSPSGRTLFLNIQHRAGSDPRDLTLGVHRLPPAPHEHGGS